MQRVRSRFPHTLELRFAPEGAGAASDQTYSARVAGRDDLSVCCGFLQHVRGREATAAEVDLLREALEGQRQVEPLRPEPVEPAVPDVPLRGPTLEAAG
jgi:exonuclease SbcD